MRMTPVAAWLAVSALLGGCQISTRYTPRTPGKAALGIHKGEVAVYKTGVRTPLSSATPGILRCSPSAGATAALAAEHQASYRSNTMLAGGMYALGVFAPPLSIVGGIFAIRAAGDQHDARASLVDAINQHNDDAACAAPATARSAP